MSSRPGREYEPAPDEPSCVRVDHLSVHVPPIGETDPKDRRSKRGGGSLTRLDVNKWKITLDAGRDETGKRRRLTRTIHGTKAQANRALASLTVDIAEGTARPSPAGGSLTVGSLIEWYLEFARDVRGLEHSTLIGYRDVYDKWLADQIGSRSADRVSPADLDDVFGRMRRAGLSRSRMNNARALLSGAYKWGRRHKKVGINPVAGFELPVSTRAPKATPTPEIDELLRLVTGADEHDPDLAPVIKLAATTGMRRGELAGLRRDRLRLDRHEIVVDTAVNDAGGRVVIKPTKTKQSRLVSLDEATIEMLADHLAQIDTRAAACGVDVAADGFVFTTTSSSRCLQARARRRFAELIPSPEGQVLRRDRLPPCRRRRSGDESIAGSDELLRLAVDPPSSCGPRSQPGCSRRAHRGRFPGGRIPCARRHCRIRCPGGRRSARRAAAGRPWGGWFPKNPSPTPTSASLGSHSRPSGPGRVLVVGNREIRLRLGNR